LFAGSGGAEGGKKAESQGEEPLFQRPEVEY